MLQSIGYSEEEASDLATKASIFDKAILDYQSSEEEKSNLGSYYSNRVNLETLNSYSELVDFNNYYDAVTDTDVTEIVVPEEDYFKNLDQLLRDNEDEFKAWAVTTYAIYKSPYLTDEARLSGSAYLNQLQGIEEDIAQTDSDFETLAFGSFTNTLGNYYGETYLGSDAKQDVETMVEQTIAAFKTRLEANDWLDSDTKQAALDKLATVAYSVGYTENIPFYEEGLTVDESKSYYENSKLLDEQQFNKLFEVYTKEPIASLFPAHLVNAGYSPLTNDFIVTASFLQGVFYDESMGLEEKYGALATTIGHELLHGFDTNGSQFDKDGQLNNWWSDEASQVYEERVQAIVDLFTVDYKGNQVNGVMTSGENIADLEGLKTALVALQTIKEDADLSQFFEAYARTYRQKATDDYYAMNIATDVHSPNELRVNLILSNVAEFYETYNIKEGDAMYLAPENRVNIW